MQWEPALLQSVDSLDGRFRIIRTPDRRYCLYRVVSTYRLIEFGLASLEEAQKRAEEMAAQSGPQPRAQEGE